MVEKGGWDAPTEPYCLFVAVEEGGQRVNVIETAPQPVTSAGWAPHNIPGEAGTILRAPTTQEAIDIAPLVMIEAIASWGLAPWDLALVFGTR